jgi:ABC-type molybdate transport system substrate-binding protein
MKSLMVTAVALAVASPITVHAVELTAFVSNALKSTVEEHSVTLDKGSGVQLKATYGTTEPLRLRIEKGEMVDFALLGEEAIDDLLKSKLVAGSRVAIARAGLVLRSGSVRRARRSSADAFKRVLAAIDQT